MPGDKITKDDLFEGDLFADETNSAEAYKTALEAIVIANKRVIQSNLEAAQNNPFKNSADIKAFSQNVNQAAAANRQLGSAQKALTKIRQDELKVTTQQTSAYTKLSKQLIEQKKAVKDLLASKKELTDSDKALIKRTQELDKELKQIDSTVGDNQRRVGGYKEALQDISAELGVFGGGLNRVVRTLKVLEKENEGATTGTQKFGNALKVIGTGALLAIIAGLVEGFNALKESSSTVANKMESLGESFKTLVANAVTFNGNIAENVNKTEELIASIQKNRQALRDLGLDFSYYKLQEEYYNQIVNDTTISYNERIEAQKKAIEFGEAAAKKNVEIAKTELESANEYVRIDELRSKTGDASNEAKNKQNEAIKKFREAESQAQILELEDAKKIREINAEKAIEEIDLILKKKQAANEDKAILEQQLADSKRQLSDRRNVSQQLLAVNNKTTEEELKIFKKGFDIKFNANELLKEQDAVILAAKIKSLKTSQGHGLGDAGVIELAKIVKQYQENSLANTKTQLELDKEEMLIQERIAAIKREISIELIKDEIADRQKNVEKAHTDYEESQKKILEKGDLFNRKQQAVRNGAFDQIQSNTVAEGVLKEKALREQAQADEILANNKITDTKELNAEILKIQTKLSIDLGNLGDEQIKKEHDQDKMKLDDDKKIAAEKLSVLIKNEETILGLVDDGIRIRNERQQEALNAEIDFRKQSIDEQFDLAKEGKANEFEFQKAQLAKEEAARKAALRKQQREEEAIKLSGMFLSNLNQKIEKGEPFLKASGEALAEVFGAKGLASLIAGTAYEGVEDTGPSGGLDGKGGKLWMVHPHERIFKRKHNEMIPSDMSNEELAQLAATSKLLPSYMMDGNPRGSFGANVMDSIMIAQLAKIAKHGDILEQIASRPATNYEIDRHGNVIERRMAKAMEERIVYANTQRKRL